MARLPGSDLTRSDQFVGSPGYMSPEQLKGGAVDGRSDLFALGVILYQLLTGRSPFEGESVSEVLYKISTQPADPPSEIHPDVSPDFDPILEKALSKDPADRYQTGKEMMAALCAVAGIDAGMQEEGAARRAESAPGHNAVSAAFLPSPWRTLSSQWQLGALVFALLLTLIGVNWAIHLLIRGPLGRPGGQQGSLAVVGAAVPAGSAEAPSDVPIQAVCAKTYADPVEMAKIVAAKRRSGAFGLASDDMPAGKIRLELSHRLPAGRIVVRVDGRTVLSKPFDSAKGTKRSLSHLLSVPAGRHGVEVRLLDEKGSVEAASKIAGTVTRDRVAVLKAEQKSGLRKSLTLAWASRENRGGDRSGGRSSF